jgi:hypothetical protein
VDEAVERLSVEALDAGDIDGIFGQLGVEELLIETEAVDDVGADVPEVAF